MISRQFQLERFTFETQDLKRSTRNATFWVLQFGSRSITQLACDCSPQQRCCRLLDPQSPPQVPPAQIANQTQLREPQIPEFTRMNTSSTHCQAIHCQATLPKQLRRDQGWQMGTAGCTAVGNTFDNRVGMGCYVSTPVCCEPEFWSHTS